MRIEKNGLPLAADGSLEYAESTCAAASYVGFCSFCLQLRTRSLSCQRWSPTLLRALSSFLSILPAMLQITLHRLSLHR